MVPLQHVSQFDMKTIATIFSILLFGSIFVGFSYGQEQVPPPNTDPTLYDISLQITLRNSDGQLVVYLEPTIKYLPDVPKLHEYLDTKPNKTTISKDGKTFESIKVEIIVGIFVASNQVTGYNFFDDDGDGVLAFRHDAYMPKPGDVLTVNLSVIRTFQ